MHSIEFINFSCSTFRLPAHKLMPYRTIQYSLSNSIIANKSHDARVIAMAHNDSPWRCCG